MTYRKKSPPSAGKGGCVQVEVSYPTPRLTARDLQGLVELPKKKHGRSLKGGGVCVGEVQYSVPHLTRYLGRYLPWYEKFVLRSMWLTREYLWTKRTHSPSGFEPSMSWQG
jgi:hypothetical protein